MAEKSGDFGMDFIWKFSIHSTRDERLTTASSATAECGEAPVWRAERWWPNQVPRRTGRLAAVHVVVRSFGFE